MLKIRSNETSKVDTLDPLESFRKQLTVSSQQIASRLGKPEARKTRAIAHYQVGNLESALADLDWLLLHGESVPLSEVLQYRTLALARLRKNDEAKESLAKYLQQEIPKSFRTYMEIQLPAWLGDYAEAKRQLESAMKAPSQTEEYRYNVACAASLCSKAAMDKNPEQAKQFLDRAIEVLGELIREGYNKNKQLVEDPDFANLYADVRFASIIKELERIPEFWVADREVSRGQFELFLSDASYPAKEKPEKWVGVDQPVSPTSDHPAQQVSWYDSLMFCNWLSLREGRRPCYERTGTKANPFDDEEYDVWRLVPGSTGYRLLRESEWEYACRAGTETEYSMGNDRTLLVSYCQMFPSKLAAVCGDKLPNAWGLHDVHGNVLEWCDLDVERRTDRVICGGCWIYEAAFCSSASLLSSVPMARSFSSGFRVALSPSVKQPEAVHSE